VAGEEGFFVKRARVRNQSLVRSRSVAGYQATSEEHAPIANGATMPVVAPYEIVKTTIVDLMILRIIQIYKLLMCVVWRLLLGTTTGAVRRGLPPTTQWLFRKGTYEAFILVSPCEHQHCLVVRDVYGT
jgi:hypothetical protein